MTISVTIAITGCPSDKRAEVVTRSASGAEAVVATLGPQTLTSNIVYGGQDLIVREVAADLEPAST